MIVEGWMLDVWAVRDEQPIVRRPPILASQDDRHVNGANVGMHM